MPQLDPTSDHPRAVDLTREELSSGDHPSIAHRGRSLHEEVRIVLADLPPLPLSESTSAPYQVDDECADIDGALEALEPDNDPRAVVEVMLNTLREGQFNIPADIVVLARERAEELAKEWTERAHLVGERILQGEISGADISFIRSYAKHSEWYPTASSKELLEIEHYTGVFARLNELLAERIGKLSPAAAAVESVRDPHLGIHHVLSTAREESALTTSRRLELIDHLLHHLADGLARPKTLAGMLVTLLDDHEGLAALTGRVVPTMESALVEIPANDLENPNARESAVADFKVQMTPENPLKGDLQGAPHLTIGAALIRTGDGVRFLDPTHPAEREILEEVVLGVLEELVHCKQLIRIEALADPRDSSDPDLSREEATALAFHKAGATESVLARRFFDVHGVLEVARRGAELEPGISALGVALEIDAAGALISLLRSHPEAARLLTRVMMENHPCRDEFFTWLEGG